MMDFLAEYMLLAFTMGAILGSAITGHIVVLRTRHTTAAMPNRHGAPRADQRKPGARGLRSP